MAELKFENKDQLLVEFLEKQTPQTKKPCMSCYRTMVYPVTGKSCWVFVYSALLVALFSGTNFEDMVASLTWPCTLPPGWSVEWDGPSAGADHPPAEWCFRTGFIDASHPFVRCLLLLPLRLWHLNNLRSWNSVVLYYSEHGFVINLLFTANSEMYETICVVISGLTFVWVLSVRSWNSVAFIESSLQELPMRAELG